MAILSSITATVTEDAQSSTITIPSGKAYSVYQNVTAVGSGDTLDVTIEESPDGGTTWYTAATFTQATGVAKEKETIPAGHADLVRINYNITAGSGSSVTVTHKIATE